MPQLSLYLDDSSMNALRKQAKHENVSLSQYVREVLENTGSSGWPKGYWDTYGALEDDTFVVPQDLDFSNDITRPGW